MPFNIPTYLMAKNGNVPVGAEPFDIPAYLMAKAAGGKIQEITGTLPLAVRSRASQILKNYIIYGTASGAGVETENLFDIANVTQVTVPELGARYGATYADVGKYTIKTYGSTGNYLYAYQYNENNELVAFEWIVQTPSARQRTFTLDSGDVLYLVAAIEGTTYEQAISRFTNWLPVVCKGSTPPSSYIPHGYKLPMTVTSNGTTTDYSIYIGDSKLGEEEYVDYEEQKIYKRTVNVYGGINASFTISGVDFSIDDNKFTLSGKATSAISSVNTSFHTNTVHLLAGEYYLKIYKLNGSLPVATVLYKTVGYTQETICPFHVEEIGFTLDEDADIYMGIYISKDVVVNGTIAVTIVSGSTSPASYIPYLQPTDPPASLPDITLPQGKVTIDIEGELKPQATIKGKIEQIT